MTQEDMRLLDHLPTPTPAPAFSSSDQWGPKPYNLNQLPPTAAVGTEGSWATSTPSTSQMLSDSSSLQVRHRMGLSISLF